MGRVRRSGGTYHNNTPPGSNGALGCALGARAVWPTESIQVSVVFSADDFACDAGLLGLGYLCSCNPEHILFFVEGVTIVLSFRGVSESRSTSVAPTGG